MVPSIKIFFSHYLAWVDLYNTQAMARRETRKKKHREHMQAVMAEAAAIREQREVEKKAAETARALTKETSARMLQNAKEEAERSKALQDNVFSDPVSEMKELFGAISSVQCRLEKKLFPFLKESGLVLTQYPAWAVDGTLVLVTQVVHLETGQSMRSIFPMRNGDDFVLLKEYALAGIFGLSAESRLTSKMKTLRAQGDRKPQDAPVAIPAKPVVLAGARFQQKRQPQPLPLPHRQAANHQ